MKRFVYHETNTFKSFKPRRYLNPIRFNKQANRIMFNTEDVIDSLDTTDIIANKRSSSIKNLLKEQCCNCYNALAFHDRKNNHCLKL